MRSLASLVCILSLAPGLPAVDSYALAGPTAPDPCAGRPGTQTFDGVCLNDRLVGFIKCVEKLGGNHLKVSRDETAKTGSDLKVEAEGHGQGLVIKGGGKAEVTRKSANESIRKVDEVFGSNATETCLVAAGLKGAPRPERPRAKSPGPEMKSAVPAPPAAVPPRTPQVQQDLEFGGTIDVARGAESKVAVVEGSGTGNVVQRVKVKKGGIKVKNGAKSEVGVVKP